MIDGTVSVVIPAYNAEKYVREAIESVLSQMDESFLEIVVVNNGSTDATEEIVRTLAEEHPCIRLFSKEFGCASTSRNMALRNITGQYVMFHDADDLLCGNAIEALYEKMAETGVDCVFALASDFKSPEIQETQFLNNTVSGTPYPGALTGCALFKRAVVEKVGLFDETLKSGETIDWMLRLKAGEFTAAELKQVTKKRRVHLTNTTKAFSVNYADALRKNIRNHFRK